VRVTNAISATESAVYAALTAGGTGITGASVYQHVPEDTAPPVVIIGDIDNVTPIGKPGDPDRRVPLTIVVITEGEERVPCSDLLGQVETILDGAELTTVDGWTIAPTLQRSTAALSEDGAGYIGLALFEVLALTN
jgi:hypothetical protein